MHYMQYNKNSLIFSCFADFMLAMLVEGGGVEKQNQFYLTWNITRQTCSNRTYWCEWINHGWLSSQIIWESDVDLTLKQQPAITMSHQ